LTERVKGSAILGKNIKPMIGLQSKHKKDTGQRNESHELNEIQFGRNREGASRSGALGSERSKNEYLSWSKPKPEDVSMLLGGGLKRDAKPPQGLEFKGIHLVGIGKKDPKGNRMVGVRHQPEDLLQ